MNMKNKKIAIIGCGNLGLSILNGILADSDVIPANITVTRRDVESLAHLESSGVVVTNDNKAAIEASELIIFALKPYKILDVIDEVSSHLDEKKHVLVSLATGVSLAQIQNILSPSFPIYRAMPNTAADVSQSMTCICSNVDDPEALSLVKSCFDVIGVSIEIDEDLMDSATVLGACGIAFVLRFIRGMVQGGIQIGFDAKTASAIVNHTVLGAAELLIQRKEHPEFEIDKVTTPRGCTIAGLNEMEHNGFSSALIKGIVTSFDNIEK